MNDDLGRKAYVAYGEEVAWTSYNGQHMPTWEVLPEKIKIAWIAAAQAIADHVRTDDG